MSFGALLGVVDVLVIALAFAVAEGDAGRAFWVLVFGLIPGMWAFGILEAIGRALGQAPRIVRVLALAAPAVGTVALLGTLFGITVVIVPGTIPTAIAALILERITREEQKNPPIPTARTVVDDQSPAQTDPQPASEPGS